MNECAMYGHYYATTEAGVISAILLHNLYMYMLSGLIGGEQIEVIVNGFCGTVLGTSSRTCLISRMH